MKPNGRLYFPRIVDILHIVTRYAYTIHAKEKLILQRIRKLKINKKRIERVIEKPIAVDTSEQPVLIAIAI